MTTLVFDLDDTLLVNPIDQFLPPYFRALTAYLAPYAPADRLVLELLKATQAMMANRDPGRTNEQVFAAHFYPALGLTEADLRPILDRFYEDEFPKLQPYTAVVPEARPLILAARERGHELVVATNPVFPLRAIQHRLTWADLGDIPFRFITAYETMHYTKPHPEYYGEILERIGRAAGECLMVGNDWDNDMAPAKAVGMRTFWITGTEPYSLPTAEGTLAARDAHAPAHRSGTDYQGALADLHRLIDAGGNN